MNNESAIKTELRWDIVSHPTVLPDATGVDAHRRLQAVFLTRLWARGLALSLW